MSNPQNIEQRLKELEMKTTFQEKLIEDLNQSIIEQQFQLDKMQLQLRYIANKLKDLPLSNIANPNEETPPPHY